MVIVIMKSIYTCIVIILLTKRSDIYFIIITLIDKLRIKNNDKTLTTNNNKEAIELPVD